MSTFRTVARTISLALLSLVGWGCGQRPAAPPAEPPAAKREASQPASVVEVTPEENPPNLKQALEQAREAADYYAPLIDATSAGNGARSQRDMRIMQAVSKVRLGFADIPVYTDDTVQHWTKVRLNTTGAGMDLIRFTNAYSFPADLIWVFALPAENSGATLRWWITMNWGSPSAEFGFKQFYAKYCLILPGLDLPPRNLAIFQHLPGGQISGGHEYFLCFQFDDPAPRDVYVKLKLVPAREGSPPTFNSSLAIAEKLGIELPFRFSDAATLTDLAADVVERQGAAAGLEYLDQRLATTSDRAAEFYRAQVAHEHAMQLAAKPEERDQANRYFLRAAAELRELQKKYGSLEPQEQAILMLALYNEACTLSLTGRPEEGLKSLQEAMQAGFNDVAQIRGDEDLQAVRALPAFKELLQDSEDEGMSSPFR